MFAFSMEGNNQPSARVRDHARAPGWSSAGMEQFRDEVGGKLRHGDPGVRLFEASASGLVLHGGAGQLPAEEGKWRIAPYYHLFGSDELSQRGVPEPDA